MDSYLLGISLHFLLVWMAFVSISEFGSCYILNKKIENKGQFDEERIARIIKTGIMNWSSLLIVFSISFFYFLREEYIYSMYSFSLILSHISKCDLLRRIYEK
jgi:hypothetical protein